MDYFIKHIGYIIAPVVVIFLLSYINKKTRQESSKFGSGTGILRYHKLYEIIAWVIIMFTGLIVILGLKTNTKTVSDFYVWLSIFCAVLALGIPLILLRRNSRVIFSEDKIECSNLFNQKKYMNWADIVKIKVNPSMQKLILEDSTQTISVYLGMIGFNDFLKTLKNKIPPALHEVLLKEMSKWQEI